MCQEWSSDRADLQHPPGLSTSLLPIKEIGFHQSFSFDFEQAVRLEMEGIP
jgi:hypothetical protein